MAKGQLFSIYLINLEIEKAVNFAEETGCCLTEAGRKALKDMDQSLTIEFPKNYNYGFWGPLTFPLTLYSLGRYDDYYETIVNNRFIFYCLFFNKLTEPILNDPKYKEILSKRGFVKFWETYGWPEACKPLQGGDFSCQVPS